MQRNQLDSLARTRVEGSEPFTVGESTIHASYQAGNSLWPTTSARTLDLTSSVPVPRVGAEFNSGGHGHFAAARAPRSASSPRVPPVGSSASGRARWEVKARSVPMPRTTSTMSILKELHAASVERRTPRTPASCRPESETDDETESESGTESEESEADPQQELSQRQQQAPPDSSDDSGDEADDDLLSALAPPSSSACNFQPEPEPELGPEHLVPRSRVQQMWRRARAMRIVSQVIQGPTVHHFNVVGKPLLSGEEELMAWAAGSVPPHVYMAACLQLGIASVSEPPHCTTVTPMFADKPKFMKVRCDNVRKHQFAEQPWQLRKGVAQLQRTLPQFKCVEYCPDVFHNLRKAFNVNTLAYRAALGMLDWSRIETELRPGPVARTPDFKLVGTADAAGKSAAWFFFSADQRFMVKIATEVEKDLLLSILESYYTRVMASIDDEYGSGVPQTLLPKFFGLYAVRTKKLSETVATSSDGKSRTVNVAPQKMYWIVMANILGTQLKIHEK